MTKGDPPQSTILAETTVCTVEDRGDGTVFLHMGAVILRLDRRALASLTGTLRKVVKTIFPRPIPTHVPRARRDPPAHLKLVHDAARTTPE